MKSGPMKSDGAGKSWYQSNSPICTCLRGVAGLLVIRVWVDHSQRCPVSELAESRDEVAAGRLDRDACAEAAATTVTLAPLVREARTSCSAFARSGAVQAPLGLGLIV